MQNKPFIRHITRGETQTTIPVTPKPWPEFPPSEKPSLRSPYRTVLWFHADLNNGVRILVEGRDRASVDAYAKLINALSPLQEPLKL